MSWVSVAVAGVGALGGYLSNKNNAKAIRNSNKGNAALANEGLRISDDALSRARAQAMDYEGRLKGDSVLSEGTRSVLQRARGSIKDRNVRDIVSTQSRLQQARIAGRGRLSAEAAQEYLTEAEAEANRAANDSNLQIDTNQAEMEMTETNNLRDRLAQAYQQMINAGTIRLQLGVGGKNAALGMQIQNNQWAADRAAQLAQNYAANRSRTTRPPAGGGGITGGP